MIHTSINRCASTVQPALVGSGRKEKVTSTFKLDHLTFFHKSLTHALNM